MYLHLAGHAAYQICPGEIATRNLNRTAATGHNMVVKQSAMHQEYTSKKHSFSCGISRQTV